MDQIRYRMREAVITIAISVTDGRVLVDHKCQAGRETWGQTRDFAKLEEAAAHVRRIVLTDVRPAVPLGAAQRRAALRAYTSWSRDVRKEIAYA
jgi:hypothetical protein